MTLREVQIAWMAGLLEGEGCFGLKRCKGRKDVLRVSVEMTDKDTVQQAAALMGARTSITTRPSRKPNWSETFVTTAHGSDAVRVMRAVAPFMGERRTRQIEENLELFQHLPEKLPSDRYSARKWELNTYDTDIAWLAGLLEGEGCFSLNSNAGRGRPSILVYLQMCDEDIMMRASNLMGNPRIGTRHRNNPKHNDSYQLRAHGQKAEDVMSKVLPYMGERRSQKIQELLSMKGLSHHDS